MPGPTRTVGNPRDAYMGPRCTRSTWISSSMRRDGALVPSSCSTLMSSAAAMADSALSLGSRLPFSISDSADAAMPTVRASSSSVIRSRLRR